MLRFPYSKGRQLVVFDELKPYPMCNGYVLASSVVDWGFEFRLGQTKDYDIIMTMCLSGLTCLAVDCCISELAL